MPREPFPIDAVQRDRAVGALLATAAGDAFGERAPAPGERAPAPGERAPAPGEWAHAAAMAVAVAEIASIAGALTAPARLDDIAQRWAWWARNAVEVGPQAVAVLAAITDGGGTVGAEAMCSAAAAVYADSGRTLDATCLTRAVPVALATLDPADDWSAEHAARKLCELTHAGNDAADATVLWTFAVRHAVRTGELDLRTGLPRLDDERRARWVERIARAQESQPTDFADAPEDVVAAVQAAWSAITTTAVPEQDPRGGVFRVDHLRLALSAVRGGGRTDTVAAAVGGLLGAAYGASALPWQWRSILRGWPGLRTHGLARLAEKIVNGGEPTRVGCIGFWREEPDPRRHPHDDGVWIGVAARLEKLPERVEAVVSLCPVADEDMPSGVLHLEVSLAEEGAPNLDFVLLDTVRAIEALRAQGHTVFVHGQATRSRAPAVAALYGARRAGIDVEQALDEVCAALPDADPTAELRAALRRLSPSTEGSPR